MKGEFMHPRTRLMLENALRHARAQFKDCACMTYGGSVWNGGTHITVIVDRCVCVAHASRLPFTDVEVWVYDISGPAPIYRSKDLEPANVELLKEPGDAQETSSARKPFLKN